MEHTKEPWKYCKGADGNGCSCGQIHTEDLPIAECYSYSDEIGVRFPKELTQANAERIVTCVNAMQGLTNEQVSDIRNYIARLEKSLDEALETINSLNRDGY